MELNHLGSIWYHSEPSDVRYSENLLRPISWFGLFLQQNDSNSKYNLGFFVLIVSLFSIVVVSSGSALNITIHMVIG